MAEKVEHFLPFGGGTDTYFLRTTVVVGCFTAIVLHLFLSSSRQRRLRQAVEKSSIRLAKGGIPLLGHALLYKKDPSGFLDHSCRQVVKNNDSSRIDKVSDRTPIFAINLAGKNMVIIGRNCRALQQITAMPESLCSARQPLADIGFEQMLGYRNVHVGTDLHKRIIKSTMFRGSPTWEQSEVHNVFHSVKRACREEVECLQNNSKKGASFFKVNHEQMPTKGLKIKDLFHFVRRVVLRAAMERFVGDALVRAPGLLEEFMVFQDALEDATAQAVVLPRAIGLVAFLWPVERKRLALQRRIAKLLKIHYLRSDHNPKSNQTDNNDHEQDQSQQTQDLPNCEAGFWLQEVMKEKPNHSVDEIAEFIVGLLFAAHKNPAIGASQAYVFLWERGTEKDQQICRQEAIAVARLTAVSSASLSATQLRKSCPRLYRLCLETLRLTAHAIGAVRKACKDIKLDGCPYVVRQGQTIGLSHITANLDETIWNQPHQFETGRDDALYEDEFSFTTFSQGIHRCPGQSYALAMMVCTLIQLLTAYDVKLLHTGEKDLLPAVSFERATLAQRAGPVSVLLNTPK
jgi:hypothetical protein